MKKIYYYLSLIVLLTGGLASCADDTADAPVIVLDEVYSVKQGATIEISATVANREDASYEWLVDNKVVSHDEKLVYSNEKVGKYSGMLRVNAKGGSGQRAFTIDVYGKYKYGTFILSEGNRGNETGTLSFIDPEGIAEDSVFIKANNGKKLGNTSQDMAIANGKLYIVAQNGTKNGGAGKLVIANAETMKSEVVIDGELEGMPTNITVPNANWAYVVSLATWSSSVGIIPIDLKTNKPKAAIAGTESATKHKMVSVNNKVFAAAKDGLLIIDGATAKLVNKIKVEGTIAGVSKTAKNNVQVIIKKDANVLLKTFNPKDYAEVSTSTLENFGINTYLTSAFCSDTKNETSAYILEKGTTSSGIAKFTDNQLTRIFSTPRNEFPNTGILYGPISVHPETGNIYIGYVKSWAEYANNGVAVVAPSGKKVKDYNSLSSDKKSKIDTRFCAGIYFTSPYSPTKSK